jgi:hypothetical protein
VEKEDPSLNGQLEKKKIIAFKSAEAQDETVVYKYTQVLIGIWSFLKKDKIK